MKEIARRCGASRPDSDVRKGWHYCYHPAGHTGMHEDDTTLWQDNDTVEVRTVQTMRAVPDHEHYFLVRTYDVKCSEHPNCPVTREQHEKLQREYEEQQADICSFCGHSQCCHTTSLPEEGSRDYCAECDQRVEFHSFNEDPKFVRPTREAIQEALRRLLGPNCPPGLLGAAVGHLDGVLDVKERVAEATP